MCGPRPRDFIRRVDTFKMQKRHSDKLHGGKAVTSHLPRSTSKRRVQLTKPVRDGVEHGLSRPPSEIPPGATEQSYQSGNPNIESLKAVGPQNVVDPGIDALFGLQTLVSETHPDQPNIAGMEIEPDVESQQVVESPPEMVEPIVPVDGAPADGPTCESGVGDDIDNTLIEDDDGGSDIFLLD